MRGGKKVILSDKTIPKTSRRYAVNFQSALITIYLVEVTFTSLFQEDNRNVLVLRTVSLPYFPTYLEARNRRVGKVSPLPCYPAPAPQLGP